MKLVSIGDHLIAVDNDSEAELIRKSMLLEGSEEELKAAAPLLQREGIAIVHVEPPGSPPQTEDEEDTPNDEAIVDIANAVSCVAAAAMEAKHNPKDVVAALLFTAGSVAHAMGCDGGAFMTIALGQWWQAKAVATRRNPDRIETTKHERDLMNHALGGEKRYRNHFAATPNSPDDLTWRSLVERGLARMGCGPDESDFNRHQHYHVTDLGKEQL